MEQSIYLQDGILSYTLYQKKTLRRLSMSVCCGGKVTVKAPHYFSHSKIERFLYTKSEWLKHQIERLRVVPHQEPKSKKDYKENKEKARELVHLKVAKWNAFYKYPYKNIAIRNQKTRWGSCSKKGTLNFNYKIVFLSEHLADYLIVHELCHLKEFNHSPQFWQLVAQIIPDYKNKRRELKSIRI